MTTNLYKCRFIAADGGLADFGIAGAVENHFTPAQAGAEDQLTYRYAALNELEWEFGEGEYQADPPLLTRTIITQSSAENDAKVNFSVAPQVIVSDAVNVPRLIPEDYADSFIGWATQAEAESGAVDKRMMSPLRTKQATAAQMPWATQAEAEAGEAIDRVMSPLRTAEAIIALVADQVGPLMASQAEAEAGEALDKIMSPLRVAQALAALLPWATQAEAQAGTLTNKLISPLRAVEMLDAWGYKLIAQGEITNQASLTINLDPATIGTFKCFVLHLNEVQTVNDDTYLWLRLGDTGGIDSGSTDYTYSTEINNTFTGNTQSNHITLSDACGNAASEGGDFIINISTNGAAATSKNRIKSSGIYQDPTGYPYMVDVIGQRNVNIDLTQVQILFSTGNIAAMKYKVMGLR